MKKVTAFKSKSGKLYETMDECLRDDKERDLVKLLEDIITYNVTVEEVASGIIRNYEKFAHVFNDNHAVDYRLDT